MFDHVGVIIFEKNIDEEQIMEAAIDGGADDIITASNGDIEIISEPSKYEAVLEFIKKKGFNPNHSEITMRCTNKANLSQSEAETMIKLVDTLEDLDDVQTVYSNAEISDEILEKI